MVVMMTANGRSMICDRVTLLGGDNWPIWARETLPVGDTMVTRLTALMSRRPVTA